MIPIAGTNRHGRILIVEDEAIVARDLQSRLARMGYDVCGIASSGEQAIEAAGEHKPNIALMDILLRGKMDGIEAAEAIAERHQIPVVYLTSHVDERTLQRAKVTKPFGYIVKPFSERELRIVVEIALYREAAQRQISEAQAALHLSEARSRTMMETAADAIVIIGADGVIQSCNPATERIFGYNAEEIVNCNFRMLVSEALGISQNDARRVDDEAMQVKRAGGSHEVEGRRKDGSTVLLDLAVATWSISGQRYFTSIMRDITGRKRIERELVLRNAELARMNARLDQFASIIGHDLRAPLRAIRHFAERIAEDVGRESPVRDHVGHALESVERMSAMLNDLLVYSRAGLDPTAPQVIHLNALIDQIRHDIETDAEVRIDIADPTTEIVASRAAIDIVLRNLIGNAICHTDKDCVQISICCHDEGNQLRFEVLDDGPGIPPEYHTRIFSPFVKVDPHRNLSGTGMGLALVKQIIEDNGGVIEVDSDPAVKRGTRFCFSWAKQ